MDLLVEFSDVDSARCPNTCHSTGSLFLIKAQ